jgi:DNA-binding transcriptional LysR family regulator
MEIRWLRSFVAVADEGGVSRAAAHLQLAQPTVTGHLKDLEKAVGTGLLDRKSRPLRLTEAGTTFIRHARLILSELDAGLESVATTGSGGVGGTVRLGTYPSATCGFIPNLLQAATRELPDVSIVLHEMSGIEMESAVESRDVDLFLRQAELPLLQRNFHTHKLWRERFYVAVPSDHSWASGPENGIPADWLLRSQMIMTGRFAPEVAAAHPLWQTLGGYPEVIHRVVHPQSLLTLVESGLAPGLTTELAVRAFPTRAALKPVDHKDAYRDVLLYWPSRRPLSAGARALIDLIIAQPSPELLTR